jgi:hypothetical protein
METFNDVLLVSLSNVGSEREFAIRVEYEFHPPCRGARDRMGLQLEPDEGGSVDIHSVKGRLLEYPAGTKVAREVGPVVDLSAIVETDAIASHILDYALEELRNEAEAAAEIRAEERRDWSDFYPEQESAE